MRQSKKQKRIHTKDSHTVSKLPEQIVSPVSTRFARIKILLRLTHLKIRLAWRAIRQHEGLKHTLQKIDPSRLLLKRDPAVHLEEVHVTTSALKKAEQKIIRLEQQLQKSQDTTRRKAKITDNPYLRGREAWNDLYGSQTVRLENAYRIMGLLSIALVIAMIGFVVISGQSRVVPYVVQEKDNTVLGVSPAEQHQPLSTQLVTYFMKKFIISSRAVRADNAVQKTDTSTAYALVKGQAATQLKAYLSGNDPFTLNQKITRDVKINYVLPLQHSHSYQVSWTETTRDLNGDVLTTQKYVAVLTYAFGKVVSGLMAYNPFGLYISSISWNRTL